MWDLWCVPAERPRSCFSPRSRTARRIAGYSRTEVRRPNTVTLRLRSVLGFAAL